MKRFEEWINVRENEQPGQPPQAPPTMSKGGNVPGAPLAQVTQPGTPSGGPGEQGGEEESPAVKQLTSLGLPPMLKRRLLMVLAEFGKLKEQGIEIAPAKLVNVLGALVQEVMADMGMSQGQVRKANNKAFNA